MHEKPSGYHVQIRTNRFSIGRVFTTDEAISDIDLDESTLRRALSRMKCVKALDTPSGPGLPKNWQRISEPGQTCKGCWFMRPVAIGCVIVNPEILG